MKNSCFPHLFFLCGEAAERRPCEGDVVLEGEEVLLVDADPVPRVQVRHAPYLHSVRDREVATQLQKVYSVIYYFIKTQ